jgi:hypothetical protein
MRGVQSFKKALRSQYNVSRKSVVWEPCRQADRHEETNSSHSLCCRAYTGILTCVGVRYGCNAEMEVGGNGRGLLQGGSQNFYGD